MQKFLDLIDAIDSTTSSNEKIQAIANYFSDVNPADAAWALFFLSGQRFKRLVSFAKLRDWGLEESHIPYWLYGESLAQVGDTAEAISLLVKGNKSGKVDSRPFDQWMKEVILPLKNMPEESQKETIITLWSNQSYFERFVMNKILTGAFRMGVSFLLTVKGLSKAFNIPTATLNYRLAGDWEPSEEFFRNLTSTDNFASSNPLNPYPFFLAAPYEGTIEDIGKPEEWLAEWKWDGIRAQIIARNKETAIWSRGNDLITHVFPELFNEPLLAHTFVFDGEILAFEHNKPRPFADLQKRLGRKKVTASIQKQYPVGFMVYDLLEWDSIDMRSWPYVERRKKIEEIFHHISHPLWHISPVLPIAQWEDILRYKEQAGTNLTEGLVLKKKDSKYGVGRRRGHWWKYKVEPMTIDAILLYAQPGSGYRSGLYTDYTFAVWDKKELVPIAKAYSGLSQDEINEMDKWIRKNTIEKFGPVRRVKPEQVFELAFENIQISKRHKSGLAVRFPRIKRWRKDKPPEQADDLERVHELLKKRSSYEG